MIVPTDTTGRINGIEDRNRPAAQLYVELGYGVVAVSRPGYGQTRVGRLTPATFAPLVDEVRHQLGYSEFAAVAGTSFGGQQAIAYAGQYPNTCGALILHSAAPSTLSYPDSAAERRAGPIVFHPMVERLTWGAVAGLMKVAPGTGLSLMMGSLSTGPPREWLPQLTPEEQQEIRDEFRKMRSAHGFQIDLASAKASDANARRAAQQRITRPTLITASRQDGGVAWSHAEDIASTIPGARLAEIAAPSHIFWIGRARSQVKSVVSDFLSS